MKKKAFVSILTIALTTTLTACNFEFSVKPEITQSIKDSIQIEIDEQLESTLIDLDFTDETALKDFSENLTEWANEYSEENEILDKFEKATLVRVVDGDTIVVEIKDQEYKVRLIGINTPESVAPEGYRTENTQEGVDASEYVKNMLHDVNEIYLQKDVSDTDKYGRLLRYVWLAEPENETDMDEITEKMLNAILVQKGIAEPVVYYPDITYSEVFDELYDYQLDN